MSEQISFIGEKMFSEKEIADLERQAELFSNYAKKKRRWENAFQRWSDEQSLDGYTALGCCGYGTICDWCEDNSYGRPCVRALNDMCREKGMTLNYDDMDFSKIW